jgi:hypothetical protein
MPLRMLSMPGKEKNPFGEHEALRGFTLMLREGKKGECHGHGANDRGF